MWSPRRIVLATIAAISFLFLLRHATSSQITKDNASHEGAPNRPYPPPVKDTTKKGSADQQVFNDITSLPLPEKLKYYYPYEPENKFPSYIWQTWKVGPSSGEFGEYLRPLEASWSEKHPSFVHEVITDEAADHLIRYLYASVPAIHEAYSAMPVPVLKADFFRYLILFARGGIYSDIDTEALKPAVEWLPETVQKSTDVGLVVGIEADPDRDDWQQWYSRRIQFCQWTIQAKVGHPILRDIIAKITEKTLAYKRQGLLKSGKIPASISIVEFTGPAIWTDTIFDYFNNHDYFNLSPSDGNITAKDFFNLTRHKKVGDVMVLPITSFSPGVGQMNAGDVEDPMAFVRHDFEGSWKPPNERMKDG